MSDAEAKLLDKLRKIEALFAGATTPGEAVAAAEARKRVQARLFELEAEAPPIEYRFTLGNMWSRKLFVALLRRYGLTPYRYKRQRYTTVMVKVTKRFVDETLWPEFQALDEVLERYLDEVAERIIAQALESGTEDADVIDPDALPG